MSDTTVTGGDAAARGALVRSAGPPRRGDSRHGTARCSRARCRHLRVDAGRPAARVQRRVLPAARLRRRSRRRSARTSASCTARPPSATRSSSACAQHGRLEHHRSRLRRRDGRFVEVIETVVGEFGEAGQLTEMRGYLIDVTASAEAEAALQERERQFRAVFYDAADAMLILDDNRRVVEANPAAGALFGSARRGARRHAARRADDRRGRGARRRVARAARARRGQARAPRRRARRAPRLVECSYRARVQADRHLCIARDITERRLLEERLMQSEKIESIGRLAGGIAHDFNNLLTAILGYTELLLGNRRPDDPDRGDLEEIQKAGQRAAALTQQLLAFSRKQVLMPKEVDLNQTVTGLRSMLTRLIREDIRLSCDVAPAPAHVKIDPNQIEQVILNLVLNARDALPSGGADPDRRRPRPRLRGRRPARPADAGRRLRPPPRVRRRRRHSARSARAPVRAVLHDEGDREGNRPRPRVGLRHRAAEQRLHLGRRAQRASGRPSRCTFRRCRSPTPPTSPPAATTGAGRQPGDDPARRGRGRGARDRQRRAAPPGLPGARGVHARAARATSSSSTRTDIDLLLTDVVMPEMNGPALAQRLVALRPSCACCSSRGTPMSPRRSTAENPNISFLSKPFQASVLANRVKEILKRPRAGGGPARS